MNNPAANLPPKPRTKHAALARPNIGEFGRHELAILGAPCGKIKDLVTRLLPHLAPELSVGYVDADHATADADDTAGASPMLQAGATAELTDKIQFRRLDQPRAMDKFSQPEWLAHQSLVLVNGNHFRAKQQIIILDPAKPLDRKLDKLTDVQLILRVTEGQALPEYLQNHLPGASQIPSLDLADTDGIAAFVKQWWQASVPPLRGLVLAGGKVSGCRLTRAVCATMARNSASTWPSYSPPCAPTYTYPAAPIRRPSYPPRSSLSPTVFWI